MPRRRLAVPAAVVVLATIGCSAERTGAPPVAADAMRPAEARAAAAAGTYELSFLTSGLVPVTSLVVGSGELTLGAHVAAAATGQPAAAGVASFEYCSLEGLPPNDITRADESPLESCASGDASWARLGSAEVNASGNAYLNFGVVQIPRTVGFRFRYAERRSGIAGGTSEPANFTWVAAP
jgi:hypothetical protein